MESSHSSNVRVSIWLFTAQHCCSSWPTTSSSALAQYVHSGCLGAQIPSHFSLPALGYSQFITEGTPITQGVHSQLPLVTLGSPLFKSNVCTQARTYHEPPDTTVELTPGVIPSPGIPKGCAPDRFEGSHLNEGFPSSKAKNMSRSPHSASIQLRICKHKHLV